MPRTEAGKRLLKVLVEEARVLPDGNVAVTIDAIEDEAIRCAHEGDAEFLDDLTAEWEAKVVEARDTLDEERLARALHEPWDNAETHPEFGVNGCCRACGEPTWSVYIDAAAVAKAYREDTDG